MNCPSCGMKVGPADAFCRVCGAPVAPPSGAGSGLRFGPSARRTDAPASAVPGSDLRFGVGADGVSDSGLRISGHAAGAAYPDSLASPEVYAPASGDAYTPAPSSAPAAFTDAPACDPIEPISAPPAPRRVRKQSPGATALVVVLALVVLAAAVYLPYRFLYLPFVQNRPLTRTALLEKYLQAVMEHDPKTAFALTPYSADPDLYDVFSQQVLTDDKGEARKDLKKKYGKYTVEVRIEQTKEYNEELMDKVLMLFSMNYQFCGYKLSEVIETGAIAEVVQVKGTCTIQGKKGSDTTPFTATVVKYDDEWKVLDSSFTDKPAQIDLSRFFP